MATILTVLLYLAIIGVVLYLINRVPMPPIWRTVIYAAAAILGLLFLIHLIGGNTGFLNLP